MCFFLVGLVWCCWISLFVRYLLVIYMCWWIIGSGWLCFGGVLLGWIWWFMLRGFISSSSSSCWICCWRSSSNRGEVWRLRLGGWLWLRFLFWCFRRGGVVVRGSSSRLWLMRRLRGGLVLRLWSGLGEGVGWVKEGSSSRGRWWSFRVGLV